MIYLREHPNGIFNQLLALEVSHAFDAMGESLTIYNSPSFLVNRPDYIYNKYFETNSRVVSIHDLFDAPDLNVPRVQEDLFPIDSGLGMTDFYYNCDESMPSKSFGMGRKQIKPGEDYIFSSRGYAYYSSYFANRPLDLDKRLSQIAPKPEYSEFADAIAKDIGSFNGAHIRRTDHIQVVNLADYDIVSKINFDNQVFVATDDPTFEKIPKNSTNIDNFILENYYKDFCSLSILSGHTLALVSALVMSYASDFVGTLTSTYTGYIQRQRYFKDNSKTFNFFNDMADTLDASDADYEWSWHRMRNAFIGAPNGIALIREWPESKLCAII